MTTESALNTAAMLVSSDLKILILIRKLPTKMIADELAKLEYSMVDTLAKIYEMQKESE